MAKIDLVYLWVDNSDPDWQKKQQKYMPNYNTNKDAISACRFINNDELKYSLRSAEKNIPWINHVYIITDEQIPNWLNTNNSMVTIVNHSDIISSDKLPVFNSCAIEIRIPYIENLSEKFIYANDDMFFWQPTEPSFFFDNDKPIYYAGKKIRNKNYTHMYGYTINRAYKLIKEHCGADIPYFPHHNADPYTKSLFLDCINEFKDEFSNTLEHRYRDISDIQRTVIMYYSVAKNKAILKHNKISLFNFLLNKQKKSCYFELNSSSLRKIKTVNCNLLCINDSRKTKDKDRTVLKEILEQKFPEKSMFEKE